MKLLVGPLQFDIVHDQTHLTASKLWGQFDPIGGRIVLGDTPDPTRYVTVFLHEVLHAIMDASGIGHVEWNEQASEVISTWLMMIIRDNPEIMRCVVNGGDLCALLSGRSSTTSCPEESTRETISQPSWSASDPVTIPSAISRSQTPGNGSHESRSRSMRAPSTTVRGTRLNSKRPAFRLTR